MFRAWGLLDWALGLSKRRKWKFVGCIGPEERSIATLVAMARRRLVGEKILLKIEEPNSPYAETAKQHLARREKECRAAKLKLDIISYELLSPITVTDPICDSPSPSVALDITSLPKRYFFYLLKRYLVSPDVKDLVVTYAFPERYPTSALTEDHDFWDALPTFRQPDPVREDRAHRRLIVNIGFIPDGLIAHLEGLTVEKQIDLVIPFPAPISSVQRAWQSVWALTSTHHEARFHECRVGANDLCEAFELILSLLPQDTNLVSFAPFGPKPISAAMCLYATMTGSPVYYAQPKIYLPNYSIGIGKIGGLPKIYAYWIKHDGKNLYDLPDGRKKVVD